MLPWYDLPEMQALNDAFWQTLAELLAANGLREIPPALYRMRADAIDDDAGECLFTQTCGYPLLTTARDRFRVLGAPAYDVPGCTGSRHHSAIVVRGDGAMSLEDLRGLRFAINETDSNTGMNLPRRLFAPLARDGRFFGSTTITGSHAASAALVTDGGADAAAIDCVTFALLGRYRPQAIASLRIVARTADSPTPPFVTSRTSDGTAVAALRRSLQTLLSEPIYAQIRDPLLLSGVSICDASAYEIVTDYARDAARFHYPDLR